MSKTLTADEFIYKKHQSSWSYYPPSKETVSSWLNEYAEYREKAYHKAKVESDIALLKQYTDQATKKGRERFDLLIEIEQKLLKQ